MLGDAIAAPSTTQSSHAPTVATVRPGPFLPGLPRHPTGPVVVARHPPHGPVRAGPVRAEDRY